MDGLSMQDDGLSLVRRALHTTSVEALAKLTTKFMKKAEAAMAGRSQACFGDLVTRNAGKYEVRLPQLELGSEKFPQYLLGNMPWVAKVGAALAGKFELRSATVIISAPRLLLPAEAKVEHNKSQEWHSDGTVPPIDQLPATTAYGVVVYLPLEDVPPDGGRVEYLLSTHSNYSQRVAPDFTGDAVLYDYKTIHRGLPNLARGLRPVLKLDYLLQGIKLKQAKDQWCEDVGFLVPATDLEGFIPSASRERKRKKVRTQKRQPRS